MSSIGEKFGDKYQYIIRFFIYYFVNLAIFVLPAKPGLISTEHILLHSPIRMEVQGHLAID
jgi:hypothetical protein